MMERALAIKHPKQLDDLSEDYSRIYFGEEFCEKKCSVQALKEVLPTLREKKLAFSYLTPFVTHRYFNQVLD